jgi:hypothetical protein
MKVSKKKNVEKKSKSLLLSKEERHTLSQPTPREKAECPICGKEVELQRNGTWTCIASEKIDSHGFGNLTLTVLTCGARGVTVPNEEGQPELVATQWPHRDED